MSHHPHASSPCKGVYSYRTQVFGGGGGGGRLLSMPGYEPNSILSAVQYINPKAKSSHRKYIIMFLQNSLSQKCIHYRQWKAV